MQRFKVLGCLYAEMAYLDLLDLVTASLSTSALVMDVATGQGAKIATALSNAAPGRPVEASIGSERIYIPQQIITGDTGIVIQRAKEGTVAAIHLAGTGNVKMLSPIWIPRTNNFTLDPNRAAINFDGDSTREVLYISNGVTGIIRSSELNTDLFDKIAGAAAVTAGIPEDEALRYYPEIGAYPFVRLRVILKAQNSLTGAQARLRSEAFKASLNFPFALGAAANNAAQEHEYAWSSEFTTTSLDGLPLPGASGDPVHYTYAVLS